MQCRLRDTALPVRAQERRCTDLHTRPPAPTTRGRKGVPRLTRASLHACLAPTSLWHCLSPQVRPHHDLVGFELLSFMIHDYTVAGRGWGGGMGGEKGEEMFGGVKIGER